MYKNNKNENENENKKIIKKEIPQFGNILIKVSEPKAKETRYNASLTMSSNISIKMSSSQIG